MVCIRQCAARDPFCLTYRPERLELDRRRAARALAAGAVDAGAADAADRAFLRLMLRLLSAVGPGMHSDLPKYLSALELYVQQGVDWYPIRQCRRPSVRTRQRLKPPVAKMRTCCWHTCVM